MGAGLTTLPSSLGSQDQINNFINNLVNGLNTLFSPETVAVIGVLIFAILIAIIICTILFSIQVYLIRAIAIKNEAIKPLLPSFKFGKKGHAFGKRK